MKDAKERNKINLHFGNKELPSFLTEKGNTVRIILFTTVYSLLFINIFRPFNSENWLPHMSDYDYFFYGSLLVVIGMVVISLSRMLMGFVVKRASIGTIEYFSWLFTEVLVLAIFYVIIANNVNFIKMYQEANNLSFNEAIFDIFKKTVANTFWMLIIPYIMSILYLSNQDLKSKIAKLKNSDAPENDKNYLQFYDEKGEMKISIMATNVIYLEAADNYVTIKYLKNNTPLEFSLRNSLKSIAEGLTGTAIQRCHRSFMVNFEHVVSLRKDNGELYFEFNVPGIKEIPISKTYNNKIMELFMTYSHQS